VNKREPIWTPGRRTAELLRSHELEAYRTAYYLLQDERLAVEAARNALLSIGKVPDLPGWTDAVRQAAVKKAAIREALAVAREALPRRLPS